MSSTDLFPVDPDYAVTRTIETNVLRTRVDSAREFFRQKAATRRIFDLVFSRRPVEDWRSIENFRLAHMADYFTFADKTVNRSFSVFFNTEPVYEEAGNEQFNIRLQLIEAVGASMAIFPSFAAGNPFATIFAANATDLGSNGIQFVYAGYGYRVNGSFSQVFLDDSLTAAENPKLDIALGLHRVRIVGGAPTSLDYLI
jgi:hypothetical protein